jgi:hypothetical protein
VKKRGGFPLLSGVVVAVALVIGLAAHGDHSPQATDSGGQSAPAQAPSSSAVPSVQASVAPPASPGTALALLAALPVRQPQGGQAYQRTADFGRAWLDMDGNGCDTRDDVLARDLGGIARAGSCEVLSGRLADPYTGQTIAFQRGRTTSALVQIDHVVPLGDAWQTGAQSWTQERREQFANDDGNLMAVDRHSNESKGDKDASAWLPPAVGFQCAYVARQVSAKAAYGLWVTPAEEAAMARVLSGCPARQATPVEFPG